MRPVLIIPVPNTTVLGAVATGNINAQLALIAAGTIMISGAIPEARAAAAKTGIKSVVLAVLEVVSVRNVTTRQITAMSAKVGIAVIEDSHWPIKPLKPELENPLARQMPPENSNNTPQGMVLARCQSNSLPPLPFDVRKTATTANRATEASLAHGISSKCFQPPKGPSHPG
jgi:hypothetical protein